MLQGSISQKKDVQVTFLPTVLKGGETHTYTHKILHTENKAYFEEKIRCKACTNKAFLTF